MGNNQEDNIGFDFPPPHLHDVDFSGPSFKFSNAASSGSSSFKSLQSVSTSAAFLSSNSSSSSPPSSALSRPSLEGRVLGSRYLVMQQIGRGTSSTIHKARRIDLSKGTESDMALKIVSAEKASPGVFELHVHSASQKRQLSMSGSPGSSYFPSSNRLVPGISGEMVGTEMRAGCSPAVQFTALGGNQQSPVDCIKAEERALSTLKGLPTVVQMSDSFKTSDGKHLVLVLEHLAGGSLLEVLKQRAHNQLASPWTQAHFSETDSAHIAARVVHALCHCHRAGFAHLDVKPENILFASNPARPSSAKLADFGLACHVPPGTKFTATGQFCGSSKYMAPELIVTSKDSSDVRGYHFSLKSDMWSLGVVAYLMLTGCLPFQDKNYLKSDGIVFQHENWRHNPEFTKLSANAQDFVSRLLCIHGEHRMSSPEAWRHPFLRAQVQTLRSNGIDLSGCAPFPTSALPPSVLVPDTDMEMDDI